VEDDSTEYKAVNAGIIHRKFAVNNPRIYRITQPKKNF
jgi:hypothetical protein